MATITITHLHPPPCRFGRLARRSTLVLVSGKVRIAKPQLLLLLACSLPPVLNHHPEHRATTTASQARLLRLTMALSRQASVLLLRRSVCAACPATSTRTLVSTSPACRGTRSASKQPRFRASDFGPSSTPSSSSSRNHQKPWSNQRRQRTPQYGSKEYQPRRRANAALVAEPRAPRPEDLLKTLDDRIDRFVASDRATTFLQAYGFEEGEILETIIPWADRNRWLLKHDRGDRTIEEHLRHLGWDAEALSLAFESGQWSEVFEAAILRRFLTAMCDDPRMEHLHSRLQALLQVTDISNIAQSHVLARSMNRNFHLHMGPTNSGKTYSALKALSKAKTGVYAGPLRLLAHEVWERINLGTVGGMDGKGRPCNLLTGEERRLVAQDAGLMSCTVEMVPLQGYMGGEPWDVVVIDEIQMLGDPDRGAAWANAVMGVAAKEIHLCGDETTEKLLEEMIAGFKGDTLTVHKYERLTPLRVADEGLHSDMKKVQAGDCVVTFSRSNVFALKNQIERQLGTKAAVVYGALPPETRAEQARDFNEGRAQVLVASDAVGMGLNLKINRIIFETLWKWNGKQEVPLSISSAKQIAGRAGRFGQQRTSSALDATTTADAPGDTGGTVTTLHDDDFPLLKNLLSRTLPPVKRAVIDPPPEALTALQPLLPAKTSYESLIEHFWALAKLPPRTTLSAVSNKTTVAPILEPFRNVLTLSELQLLTHAPLPARDEKVIKFFSTMVWQYAKEYHVDLMKSVNKTGLMQALESVEKLMKKLDGPPKVAPQAHDRRILVQRVPELEALHKCLTNYLWLSFRFELAFPDREIAAEMKSRTEKMLEACLEHMPVLHKKKRKEATAELDADLENIFDEEQGGKPKLEWSTPEEAQRDARRKMWESVAVLDAEPAASRK